MTNQINLRLHKKQSQAYLSKATEILFGGAAFGGKSHLFRVAAIAWCTAIPGLQVYLFRRTFPDLWKNHMEGAGSFVELLATWIESKHCRIIEGKNQIRFRNGSKIHLCHCQYEKDVLSYQGAEIHVLMIDELTQWPESMYRYLRGRVRLGGLAIPAQFAGLFPRILCGANPGGIGHNWVRSSFVKLAPAMTICEMSAKEGGMRRQFIPARLEDNPVGANDPTYEQRLEGLGNPALIKAMRYGDWDIVAGGALDDVWNDKIILPRFKLPHSWRLDRSFDWGLSKPFSVLWFGQADGTEASLPNGKKFAPPRGSLVVVNEWYGAKGPNEGLNLPDRDIAKGIVRRENELLADKWFPVKPQPGPADNMIRDARQGGTPTPEKEMALEGVRWTESDKAPGTRISGLQFIRSRFIEAAKDRPENPGLWVMENCVQAIEHWPVLPRDKSNPDDVDSDAEDHDYDALRYRVLASKPPTSTVTPLHI